VTPLLRDHPRGGFTLIEVTGALLIFTVGVFATIQLSQALSERLNYSGTRTRVVAEVQERIDSIRAEGYAAVVVTSGSTSLTLDGVAYTVMTSITQYSPLVRRISITAAPTSGSGPTHSMTSYLSTTW